MNIRAIDKISLSHSRSIFLLIITAVLWSFGGLLIKWVNWNPAVIAGMRSAIAALMMLAIIRRPQLPRTFAQIIGAVAYAGAAIMLITANKMTTAANAVLLFYTAPIYVAILGGWFLKERVNKSSWVTIFLVLGGMCLFFVDSINTGSFTGNILGVLSGFSFAVTAVCLRSQKSSSPIVTVFWGNVLTALIGIPFMFGSMPDASGWTGLILMGVFQTGLSYILFTIAIKQVTALESTLIPIIEPILNPMLVFFVIGEVPGIWAVIGGCIVLLSITLHNVKGLISIIRRKICLIWDSQ